LDMRLTLEHFTSPQLDVRQHQKGDGFSTSKGFCISFRASQIQTS
jgi:hypothetical protein